MATEILNKAKELIENDDPVVHDVADENGQVLENIKHMAWFINAVADRVRCDSEEKI